jgi:hypothetical protein
MNNMFGQSPEAIAADHVYPLFPLKLCPLSCSPISLGNLNVSASASDKATLSFRKILTAIGQLRPPTVLERRRISGHWHKIPEARDAGQPMIQKNSVEI